MKDEDSARLERLRDALRRASRATGAGEFELRAAPDFWDWLLALKGPMGLPWVGMPEPGNPDVYWLFYWTLRRKVDPAAKFAEVRTLGGPETHVVRFEP